MQALNMRNRDGNQISQSPQLYLVLGKPNSSIINILKKISRYILSMKQQKAKVVQEVHCMNNK